MKTILTAVAIMAFSLNSFGADCEPRTKTMNNGLSTILTTCSGTIFNSKLFTDKDRKKIVSIFDEVSKKMPKQALEDKYVWNFYSDMFNERNPQIGQKKNGLNFGEGIHNYNFASCKEFTLYHLEVVPLGDVVVMDKRHGLVIPPSFQGYRGHGYLCKNTKNPTFWETIEHEDYVMMRKAGKMNEFIPGGTESMIAGESEDPADATK